MPKLPIFENKDPSTRFQGILTPQGGKDFETAKKRLRALYKAVVGSDYGRISDGDVTEYLARGDVATRAYLKATKVT